MLFRIMAVVLAFATSAEAAGRDDIDFVIGSSLPPEVWTALEKANSYAVQSRINPFYLQGDFDGDGTRDAAVLVKERSSGKTGAAIVTKSGKLRVIGAGKDIGDGTDNLDWMDAWYVFSRGPVAQGATDERPPKLRGDAIAAIKTESATGLIWWDGKRFHWYQQGD
jgi:hypothetical protein